MNPKRPDYASLVLLICFIGFAFGVLLGFILKGIAG